MDESKGCVQVGKGKHVDTKRIEKQRLNLIAVNRHNKVILNFKLMQSA
jgi:hypothetical protein